MKSLYVDAKDLRSFWDKAAGRGRVFAGNDVPQQPIEWNGYLNNLDTIALTEQFGCHGYAVVRGPAQQIETAYGALQNLLYALGAPQGHERADMCGIAVVKAAADGKHDPAVFKGLSAAPLGHHTDGSYLCHVLPTGRLAVPPDVILLQCVRPAKAGGETELCDWQMIWRDLKNAKDAFGQSMLEELQKRQFSAERPPLGHYAFSVFEKDADDVLRVRWYDKLLYPDYLKPAMAAFKKRYLENPRYLKRLPLQAGDILVLNNGRLTHARTEQTDDPAQPRHYHRVFVSSDLGDKLGTLQKHGQDYTMGEGYRYARLDRPETSPFTREIIPAVSLRLPVGIQTKGKDGGTKVQPGYSLMLVGG